MNKFDYIKFNQLSCYEQNKIYRYMIISYKSKKYRGRIPTIQGIYNRLDIEERNIVDKIMFDNSTPYTISNNDNKIAIKVNITSRLNINKLIDDIKLYPNVNNIDFEEIKERPKIINVDFGLSKKIGILQERVLNYVLDAFYNQDITIYIPFDRVSIQVLDSDNILKTFLYSAQNKQVVSYL